MDSLDARLIRYRMQASSVTILAHVFGLLSIVLMLVWLLHFREGIDLHSRNVYRIFNVHPFLMLFGFIFMMGEALMVYKTIRVERNVQKYVHTFLNFVAIVLGTVGFHGAIKLHEKQNVASFTSLHSWIGIATLSLFCFQWLWGLIVYLFHRVPVTVQSRSVPWHINGGRVVFHMAICASLTGLMEKETSLLLHNGSEPHLINFLALVILLFGIFVDLSIFMSHYI